MTAYEVSSLAVSVFALVVSTVVLLLLVKQIQLLTRQVNDATKLAESENERQRKRATIDFVANTLSNLHELYNLLPVSGGNQESVFVQKAMKSGSEEFLTLRNYLNYLDDLCLGVNMHIVDQEVVRRMMGGRIRTSWNLYEPWIIRERKVLGRLVFDEFEECAKKFESSYQAENALH